MNHPLLDRLGLRLPIQEWCFEVLDDQEFFWQIMADRSRPGTLRREITEHQCQRIDLELRRRFVTPVEFELSNTE